MHWDVPIQLNAHERKVAKRLHRIGKFQIPSDLVVKSQGTDIIDLILQLIGHPNGVHRACHHRKSRGAVLSTSEVQ